MVGSRGLPLLLLVPQLLLGPVLPVREPVFGRSDTHTLSPEENEFVEEEEQPVLVLSSEEPEPGPVTIDCPRDCACSQEGVVDCGGIDLREFPGDLPEHTNHLSLQVRPMLRQQLSPAIHGCIARFLLRTSNFCDSSLAPDSGEIRLMESWSHSWGTCDVLVTES